MSTSAHVPVINASARRRSTIERRQRGLLVRRSLVLADVISLSAAFLISTAYFADRARIHDHLGRGSETGLFLATLPIWVLLARVLDLYERDDGRADHSTADEMVGVVSLVTFGTWVVFVGGWATRAAQPELDRLVSFWLFALLFVLSGRGIARAVIRRRAGYIQTAIVIGAGHVGQLVARKIQHHPEYGIDLLGFVDDDPRERRSDIGDAPVLGTLEDLSEIVASTNVERVIVAFSRDPDEHTMAVVRALRDDQILVDVVPRLYELVGPGADIHMIEGMPLLTVPHARLSGSSRYVKRAVDVVCSAVLLVLTLPIFVIAAIQIRRESDGPVFYRQTRLGTGMRPFTALKFRTMLVSAGDAEHRDYIRQTMTSRAAAGAQGTYKLERRNEITPFGRLLRRTSLDELPQLLNVLRGEMSLVGPRPCLPWETEYFEPHHFERFLVPQGITGHWQVAARARSTFGEALEMDVAYVRSWSVGLDLRLLLRTPFAVLRQRKATT